MSISNYQDLKVWQSSMDLAEQVYCLTETFPKHEVYQLSNQMQRAAVSIPSNIAEGHARESTKEFLRYLSIALGSLAELETQVILAQRLTYINQDKLLFILNKTNQIGRMLRGLQKSLKVKLGMKDEG